MRDIYFIHNFNESQARVAYFQKGSDIGIIHNFVVVVVVVVEGIESPAI